MHMEVHLPEDGHAVYCRSTQIKLCSDPDMAAFLSPLTKVQLKLVRVMQSSQNCATDCCLPTHTSLCRTVLRNLFVCSCLWVSVRTVAEHFSQNSCSAFTVTLWDTLYQLIKLKIAKLADPRHAVQPLPIPLFL